MVDLSYFVPGMKGAKDIPQFSGSLNGNIDNFSGKNITLSLSNHSHAHLDFKLKGLPNIEETFFFFEIKELTSSKNGIERIQIPPFEKKKYIELPPNFAQLGQITFNGKITGFPNLSWQVCLQKWGDMRRV